MEEYNKIDDYLVDYVKKDGAPAANTLKASYFKAWLRSEGYNTKETDLIFDTFLYWQMIPAKATKKSDQFVANNPMP